MARYSVTPEEVESFVKTLEAHAGQILIAHPDDDATEELALLGALYFIGFLRDAGYSEDSILGALRKGMTAPDLYVVSPVVLEPVEPESDVSPVGPPPPYGTIDPT